MLRSSSRLRFVAFATDNPFLAMWFGHVADGTDRSKASWKDDFVVG